MSYTNLPKKCVLLVGWYLGSGTWTKFFQKSSTVSAVNRG